MKRPYNGNARLRKVTEKQFMVYITPMQVVQVNNIRLILPQKRDQPLCGKNASVSFRIQQFAYRAMRSRRNARSSVPPRGQKPLNAGLRALRGLWAGG